MDVGKTKTPPNQPAVAKNLFDFIRLGICCNIEVLGFPAEQEIAHTASYEIGVIALFPESIENADCVAADPLAGNAVFRTGNDRRQNRVHRNIY